MNLTNRPLGAFPAVPVLRLVPLFALLVLLAAALSACSSGDDGDSTDTGSTGPARTTGPANATGSASGPTGATGPAGPSAVEQPNPLSALESFRFEVSINGTGALVAPGVTGAQGEPVEDATVTARGAWIAPDKAQLEMDIAGSAYKQTIIGDQEWTTLAGVQQGPAPATANPEDLLLVSSFPGPDAIAPGGFECGNPEDVNGVSAVRCDASDSVKEQVLSGFGGGQIQELSEAGITMWVAEDGGYVVKMAMNAAGKLAGGNDFRYDLQANITDINNVGDIQP